MKKILWIISILIIWIWITFADTSDLVDTINDTTSDMDAKLDTSLTYDTWGSGIKSLLSYVWIKIIIPICIMVWILIAVIWFYNLMFAKDGESKNKWRNFLIYGTIWVLLAVSGGIIWELIVWSSWWSGVLLNGTGGTVEWLSIAVNLYEKVIYPFVKVIMYLIVWILFIILVIHFFKFIWSPSEEIKAQSQRIIVWNIIWILVIMSAKKIVEATYWARDSIYEEWRTVSQLPNIWQWVLTQSNLIFMYNILNWFMGLIAFIILVIIIYQTFLMLTKPEDPELMKTLKKSFLYIFIWIIMIWAAYLLTNFVIVQAV